MPEMQVLFRTDASVTLGSGHVMRCLTLAKALTQQGANCHFICRKINGNLIDFIRQQGFTVLVLPAQLTSEQEDAHQTLVQLKQPYQLLVLDHYELGYAFCQLLRQRCKTVLVIDDLANRSHDCDLLLDQNLLPNADARYTALVPPNCKQLLGPHYALLRDEFYQTSASRQQNHILVSFGGSDEHNLTALAINAIKQLKPEQVTADIVIGENNPWRIALEKQLASLPNMQLHVQSKNMATLMQRAQLMLGAGGATHWERCISALPGLVVTIAENQQATTAYLDKLGACIWLGNATELTEALLIEKISYYLKKPELLQAVATAASSVTPAGGGALAVVEELLALQ
ncbi:UDP-2,4-diacetamido-2,4,6-trideoxy-beta-L-altropyranose hydrolase [Alishewanella tabrizica]|uniref:UDP-2,4-diacetamido-2,4, 6-trideoxy-beta-L-altropyranose hydrolase n=1 Tax=Alishewanella tabrizica TaxID=671278 RepID=A0ABQ2WQD7_9ALTE|nr:UDP-2,4-diacetamido-2,4,6-trideoxy-beta-L-altropyranose hydrolase [Alishewanella tabrizica]GGW63297.1 UDP-2,4-diacetamido-2,4,6-trideoxy-beta-L-altropyranose hydrolase [Alishewanella tabrizica]